MPLQYYKILFQSRKNVSEKNLHVIFQNETAYDACEKEIEFKDI